MIQHLMCIFASTLCGDFETKFLSVKKKYLLVNLIRLNFFFRKYSAITCVSVKCNCLARAVRLATDKYFPLSNSVSNAFICAAENAVRGRFLRSSVCASAK